MQLHGLNVTGSRPIYLDYQATTPIDPRVLKAMEPFFTAEFGNPHSVDHSYGWAAAEALDEARGQVAMFLNADNDEIIFTSGATEACNIALRGAARAAGGRNHLVTFATEHAAVYETAEALQKEGFRVDILPVDANGIIDLGRVEEAVTSDTFMISVMLVNNEIGVIQPLADIAAIAREYDTLLHTDATQAVGRLAVDVEALGVDLLTISAHKVYGPKGVGALYVRNDVRPRIAPIYTGGGQEHGLRPGTLPTPSIVGIGEACAVAARDTEADAGRISGLCTELHRRLSDACPEMRIHGHAKKRVSGNLNIAFPGRSAAETIVRVRDRLAISTGSACSSGTNEPSHVLMALLGDEMSALEGIRISLGRFTTKQEIETAAETLASALA